MMHDEPNQVDYPLARFNCKFPFPPSQSYPIISELRTAKQKTRTLVFVSFLLFRKRKQFFHAFVLAELSIRLNDQLFEVVWV